MTAWASSEPSFTFEESAPDVLPFRRGEGWRSVINSGTDAISLPTGTVVMSSVDLVDGLLPGDATAWIVTDGPAPR